ncbi:MAG: DUF459 domain-containing protein [Actinobacteria bacterium]|nr:DUF459 domain-containing protein [Actinomycetota bacterium]
MKSPIIRRVLLGTLVLGLIAGITVVEIDNANLTAAIAKQNAKPKPDPIPENPDPIPEVEEPISQIQVIKDKLAQDGCNLNADITTVRLALGTCKFLLIGDSLGNNLAYGMIPQLSEQTTLTFTRQAKASTGLSNPWFYNWHTNLATFLKTYKPNLVIVFLGANDRQDYVINGVRQVFGTEAWKKTYRANISKLATAATKSGAYVLWIGMPIMKPYNYAKGITLIDEQFALTVPQVPGAIYLGTRAYTADASGAYRGWAMVNGKYSQIRGEDGIHFTATGQQVMATYVINYINRTYHVKLTPHNPRYITK